ncbi:hypothetical protein WICMUC_005973 [Wickerhamomyces mucosus]|uniref:Ribosome-releasing factor 2, mitochondrial n=1 Tax=Wickerhamomyces mucosus TaxID=1378264 RepID=A0A9P8P270_9ASCO|nr:hypothetical protein WICMUC_005973 [Wickerhamomyces mucosus]
MHRSLLVNLAFTRSIHSTISRQVPSNVIPISKIRNIGIIAHIDAGKTTTTERMLYYSGVTSRIGNVDQGDTVTDYLPQERERGITIQSAAITIPWNKHRINLIDTPGHADFTFEVIRSLKVLDGAVTILDSVAGVEAQTEKVWKQSANIPKIIFVNKMDREGARFGKTCKEIISKLGTRILLINVPYFKEIEGSRERQFEGVLDVIDQKLLKWGPNDSIAVEELNDDQYEIVSKCRESLIETLGEIDETVIDSFFESEDYMKVPSDILKKSIKKSTLEQFATPVLCGASFKNIGVQPLLDAVTSYLPSPLESQPDIANTELKLTSEGHIIANNDKLTAALAFKVITDPIRGLMVFVRVYSGKLVSNSNIYVNGQQIKIGKLLIMNADKPQEVSELKAGNIGVIVNDNLKTGDTVLAHIQKKKLKREEVNIVVNPIGIPPPVFSISIEPKTTGDRRGVEEGLSLMLKEDPSLKYVNDEETGQLILSGMGELHLEIAVDRLKTLKAKFEVGRVMVSYKETIVDKQLVEKSLEDDGISIKLSMEPIPESKKDLPRNKQYFDLGDNNMMNINHEPHWWEEKKLMTYTSLINGIISGLIGSIQRGPVIQLPLNSTLISIETISIPDDFNNVSKLIQLIRIALIDLLKNEQSFNVMEPMMKVIIDVPPEDIGSVIQDLTAQRNGIISSIDDDSGELGVEMVKFREISESQYLPSEPNVESGISINKNGSEFKGNQTINAIVPLKEMIGYLPSLRKITKGRGNFNMEFKGMEAVTRDRLDDIVKELQVF